MIQVTNRGCNDAGALFLHQQPKNHSGDVGVKRKKGTPAAFIYYSYNTAFLCNGPHRDFALGHCHETIYSFWLRQLDGSVTRFFLSLSLSLADWKRSWINVKINQPMPTDCAEERMSNVFQGKNKMNPRKIKKKKLTFRFFFFFYMRLLILAV